MIGGTRASFKRINNFDWTKIKEIHGSHSIRLFFPFHRWCWYFFRRRHRCHIPTQIKVLQRFTMKYYLTVDTLPDFPFIIIIINNIFFSSSHTFNHLTLIALGVRRINKIFAQTPIKSTIKSYGILTLKMEKKRQYHTVPYHL